MQLVIVTGLSGSGKSVVLRALEDSGFYCVDNLPATLLPQITHHLDAKSHQRVAISIDSRSAAIDALPQAISVLKTEGVTVQVLFLESNIETLVKRFSETRRKHPLSDDNTTLAESIAQEHELLSQLASLGHRIDTSNLSANALRAYIRELIAQDGASLVLLLASFGFKNGVPLDADLVFDVRCLPNPHYDPVLRPFTGKDAPIQAFLSQQPDVNKMLADIQGFVETWLPCYDKDNRSYLTVAIGCTGGQHRSVYFVETLATYFKNIGQKVLIRHRELQSN